MPLTNYDSTDWDCLVGGRLLSEFAGLSGWERQKRSTSVLTPGGVEVGVNRQRGNNRIMFTLRVLRTSVDLPYLDSLVDSQEEVEVKSVVTRNLDSYADGQEIGLGAQFGRLSGGNRGGGDSEEADTVEFTVEGRGPLVEVKGVSASG